MNSESRKALVMMGYRQVGNNIFLKPVGYSCFCVKYTDGIFELSNVWGKDIKGEIVYWNSEKLDSLSISDIKCFELNFHPNYSANTEFEFLTPMDYSVLKL